MFLFQVSTTYANTSKRQRTKAYNEIDLLHAVINLCYRTSDSVLDRFLLKKNIPEIDCFASYIRANLAINVRFWRKYKERLVAYLGNLLILYLS